MAKEKYDPKEDEFDVDTFAEKLAEDLRSEGLIEDCEEDILEEYDEEFEKNLRGFLEELINADSDIDD